MDLVNNTSVEHQFVYFRLGEVYLNYAEAMYNAYGATSDPMGYGMNALQALNKVRQRTGVALSARTNLTQDSIIHERRVELGFEGHRWWDVRRWKLGGQYFGTPVKAVSVTSNAGVFTYTPAKLEDRVYDNNKMNWYPIPQSEISKTGWTQNPGW